MAEYGTQPQAIFPQPGQPVTPPVAPPRQQKNCVAHRRVTAEAVNIRAVATLTTLHALSPRALSINLLTGALVLDMIVFYYALKSPQYNLANPPSIILMTAAFAMSAVAFAIELCVAASKALQNTAGEFNNSMALPEKCPAKRKFEKNLKHNGKIVNESTFLLDENVQSCALTCGGQCNNPLHCGNEENNKSTRKYPGQNSANGSKFNSSSCHFENEKNNTYIG